MTAMSFGPCLNSRGAFSYVDHSTAVRAKPRLCVLLKRSTQACLACRFRRAKSRPGADASFGNGTLRSKHILQPARRSSFKCRAAGALVQEGWPLWAALSACAAGGQVHLHNCLKLHTRLTCCLSKWLFCCHAIDYVAGARQTHSCTCWP